MLNFWIIKKNKIGPIGLVILKRNGQIGVDLSHGLFDRSNVVYFINDNFKIGDIVRLIWDGFTTRLVKIGQV